MNNFLSPSPIRCNGRWRFLDGETGEEADEKARAITAINKFWSEFKASSIYSDPKKAMGDLSTADWMANHLPPTERGLEWEISLASDGSFGLAICGMDAARKPFGETMVELAGDTPGWEITSHRLPLHANKVDISKAYEARTGEKLPPFSSEMELNISKSIDVKILSPNFVGKNRSEDIGTAFVIVDMLLGEDVVNKWINYVQAENTSLGTASFDVTNTSLSLVENFQKLKQAHLDALPDNDISFNDESKGISMLGASKEQIAELMQREERHRLTALTPWPELMLAVWKSHQFYSERFLKHGQKLAYLHLKESEEKWTVKAREQFEIALGKALQSANQGVLVATGMGNHDDYYYDITLSDVDRAIPVLREFCLSQDMSSHCWLRFYDRHWYREWVRMFPNTPDLGDPSSRW